VQERDADPVKELEVDPRPKTTLDPPKRVVKLKGSVDRDSAELPRGIDGDGEGDREDQRGQDYGNCVAGESRSRRPGRDA
jgi:hypothetical protein